MIRISNIHLPLDYTSETVLNKAAKLINVDKKFFKSCTIFRRSIDARKKDNIFFLATVDAELFVNEEKICKKFKNAEIAEKYEYNVEKFRGAVSPVVVGAGPAGLFAALILAQSGANPILIERGRDVDTRTEDVHNFWKSGILDTTSNVQFGEGGAGAFSDGKLTTGTKDTRQRKVLIEFVKHGAPDEILYNAKPHIGTDKLVTVVQNIRKKIIALGGEMKLSASAEKLCLKQSLSDFQQKTILLQVRKLSITELNKPLIPMQLSLRSDTAPEILLKC